jgi:hypothetical protein
MLVNLTWSFYQNETTKTITRHCSTCGRTTTFTDTGKKRRNANGKNIFEYTIYRCEKGHSWNHKIRQYKAPGFSQPNRAGHNEHNGCGESVSRQKNQSLKLSEYQAQGVSIIRIQLDVVEGKWRLDKGLSDHIVDASRVAIKGMIKTGRILFNQKVTKPCAVLNSGGIIRIELTSEEKYHD